MITKTFHKQPHDDWYLMDETINAALGSEYHCFGQSSCFTITNDNYGLIAAQCRTPGNLTVAVWLREAITFSITLPARYWK